MSDAGERARNAGKTAAYVWLKSEIEGILFDEDPVQLNFGCNKVRFTNMVPVGSKVRLRQKCLNVEERAGGKQVVMENTIEIEGKDRPACVAEAISIIYG